MNDPINPAHYRSASGLESIDVIEAFFPNNPYRWPVLKYVFRAGKKPGQDVVQDLRKAIWWLEREIAAIEKAKPRVTTTGYEPVRLTDIKGDDDGGYISVRKTFEDYDRTRNR